MRLTAKERIEDIYDGLRVAADVAKQAVLDLELKATASYLVKYYGPELARLIAAIPGRQYFPTCVQLEDEVIVTLGLNQIDRGGPGFAHRKNNIPTDVDIDRNEREAVVSGQKPQHARAGAELIRKSKVEAQKRLAEREALAKKMNEGIVTLSKLVRQPSEAHSEITIISGSAVVAIVPAKNQEMLDIFNALEDFDKEILDDLENF